MPDDILISELSLAPAIDDGAVFPFSQDNGGTDATFKAPMSQMAGKKAETTTYANLQTTSKTLVGAINEAAQSGGSAELIGTASGSIATFNDGGNGIPLKSCEVEIVATQAGSGTPSPSNVRAISGFGSVIIKRTGENKASGKLYNGIVYATGLWDYVANRVTNYDGVKAVTSMPYLEAGTYTINVVGLDVCTLLTKNASGTILDSFASSWNNLPFTFTLTQAGYLFFTARKSNNSNLTPTDYTQKVVPGSSINTSDISTHTITLPETIYGGELECVGGSGKKTWGVLDLSSVSWTISGNRARTTDIASLIKLPESGSVTSGSKSEKYIEIPSNNALNNGEYAVNYTNGTLIFYYDGVNSPTGLLIYPLATPTPFTTTPESIPTLSGTNNIYANCGDVDVEYFNENADEIAELVNVYPYEVSGVLTAGQTSITLSSGLIKSTSTIDVYTTDGTNYNTVSVSDGSVIITFDAQVSNLGVKVRVS